MKENGNKGFWKERKLIKRDEGSSWLITKDKDRRQIFDPESNKENIARYYEDLYSKKPCKDHLYHAEVKQRVQQLANEVDVSNGDEVPTEKEIQDAIDKKKKKKATTDWKNEILKRGGIEMVRFVQPVISFGWRKLRQGNGIWES